MSPADNRCDLFNRAYSHMSGCIDKIYKDLTKSTTFPTGGVGFLSLEDAEEPYLSGVKYNVMPPGKRFVEMEQLSGGEKTMAALALLFAIHRWVQRVYSLLISVSTPHRSLFWTRWMRHWIPPTWPSWRDGCATRRRSKSSF